MKGSAHGVGQAADIARAAQSPTAQVTGSTRPSGLLYAVGAAAVGSLCVYTGVSLALEVPVVPRDLAFAVAAFAAAQLARIFHRVRGETIMLAWGEVGIITALCLVPAPWLPISVAAGAVVGHGFRLVGANPLTRTRVAYTIFVLTAGGMAAATVAALTADPARALRATPEDLGPLVPLGLAAAAYYLTTSGLSAAWAAATTRSPIAAVWRSAARTKRFMLAAAAPIGVITTFAAGIDPALIAALAPFLWVVHLTYARHVTASAEQRIWAAMAEATRALHQLDERAVALAALHGAFDIFAPMEVELSWQGLTGQTQRYRARTGDDLAETGGAGEEPEAALTGECVMRPLAVAGVRRGELRLRFRHALPLTMADEMAFSTYADAVASALHDAATHRRLQDLAARSAYDAIHDTLTGLSNRSTLLARGNAELQRCDPATPVALVLLGLDGFRAVNETLGHAAGDELLRVLARRLAGMRDEGELLGRPVGDEFAVFVLPGPSARAAEGLSAGLGGGPGGGLGEGEVLERARILAAALAAPADVAGVTIAVEARAGVVVAEAGSCDMAELLRRADVALHQAMRAGSRLARYDRHSDAASEDRLLLLADLRDALAATDQLVVQLQPAVDLVTGAPVSVEALVRWQHPRRGLLMPADFVPAIEHSELAAGFTLHIVDLALRVCAGWATQGIEVPMSVNLCARCMVNPDLPSLVADHLRRHGVPSARLILEMSESVMEGEEQLVHEAITDLRARGIRVSVDDFGTGSASLSFLTRFSVDEVKIDRSFVARMIDSPETAAIVRTTVDLARALGLRVVAEGVERPEQRTALLELGVKAAQGFLFHPPMSETDATAVVQRRTDAASARTIPIVPTGSP